MNDDITTLQIEKLCNALDDINKSITDLESKLISWQPKLQSLQPFIDRMNIRNKIEGK